MFPPSASSTTMMNCRRSLLLVRNQHQHHLQRQGRQKLSGGVVSGRYRSISSAYYYTSSSSSSSQKQETASHPSSSSSSVCSSTSPYSITNDTDKTTTRIRPRIIHLENNHVHYQQQTIQQYRSYSTSPIVTSSGNSSGDSTLHSKITELAKEPQTSVSLNALMKTGRGEFLHKTFGKEYIEPNNTNGNTIITTTAATELVLIQVAGFLRRELPIRLAHRIQDLEGIPVLRDMDSVKLVRDMYIKSIQDIISFDTPITTSYQEQEFSKIIEKIYERHSSVLVQMARGAYEFRQAVRAGAATTSTGSTSGEFELQIETHAFLDRFYLCRIGIRVLIGQYLALRQPAVDNYIGIICSHTSSYEIVKRAIDDAAFMCTRIYGDSPEVIMSGRLDLSFPYVPTHLHYIMLELIKNSMRATVEWHGVDGDFPPIKVIIADGQENEDVVIKVSDEGGGIPRSNMKKIWSYLFTTADPSIQEGMVGTNANAHIVDHGIDSPLAGLGYGLPISRSYCRYFGGDLSIMSMEGYGTDAFVYLTRLGNTQEPLPI